MVPSAENPAASPENTSQPLGVIGAWRRLLSDGLAERELIRTLFRRNFISRFAGSGLGFAWVIIMPCLPVFIYNLLQVMGVFADPGTGMPRSIFLTFGLILYFTFSETLNQVAAATVNNRAYIVQSGVPKMAIILSICVEVAAYFVIRFTVFLLVMLFTFGPPAPTVALLPLLALPLMLLGLTLGLVLNLFCVLYQDILNVVQAATFYLLFASGVFSIIPEGGVFFEILRWSPVYQTIIAGRMIALEGDFSLWTHAAWAALACVILLPSALVAFYRAERLVNSYL